MDGSNPGGCLGRHTRFGTHLYIHSSERGSQTQIFAIIGISRTRICFVAFFPAPPAKHLNAPARAHARTDARTDGWTGGRAMIRRRFILAGDL